MSVRLPTFEEVSRKRESALEDSMDSLATGPVTEAGKAASSRNALSHGLSGSGLMLPEPEAAAARRLEAKLRSELRPTKTSEEILLKQMAVHQVKAEQARAHQLELRAEKVAHARNSWSNDRRVEAAELGAKIGENPEVVVPTLLSSLEGTRWLLSRWGGLLAKVKRGGMWDETDRKLVLDLLAFPLVYRDKILPSEAERPDLEELRRHHVALAEQEIGNLRSLIENNLAPLDEEDLDRALRGVESSSDHQIRLYRRYERDAQRRFEWAWTEFHRRRKDGGATGSTPSYATPSYATLEDVAPPAPSRGLEAEAAAKADQSLGTEAGSIRDAAALAEKLEKLTARASAEAALSFGRPHHADPAEPKFAGNRHERRREEAERRRSAKREHHGV